MQAALHPDNFSCVRLTVAPHGRKALEGPLWPCVTSPSPLTWLGQLDDAGGDRC